MVEELEAEGLVRRTELGWEGVERKERWLELECERRRTIERGSWWKRRTRTKLKEEGEGDRRARCKVRERERERVRRGGRRNGSGRGGMENSKNLHHNRG